MNLNILTSLMEEHSLVTFEMYRKKLENYNWKEWHENVVFRKALMGIRRNHNGFVYGLIKQYPNIKNI